MLPIHTSPDSWGLFQENKIIDSFRCVYPAPVYSADFKSAIDYIPAGECAWQAVEIC